MFNGSELIDAIDAEIDRLQSARNLLTGTDNIKRRGRPAGSKNLKKPSSGMHFGSSMPTPPGKKRTLSAAGRKRIADAMKKRWAQKKSQTKTTAKKSGKKASSSQKTTAETTQAAS